MNRANFIKSIAAHMISVCKGTGLLPSVMISQACLESADGQSLLSSKYFNFFGMKPGSSWKGQVVNLQTTEYEKGIKKTVPQPFRVYPDLEAGFVDHIQMLQRVQIYKIAGVFAAKTAEDQCKALQRAGYATDPKYASKLIAIINENGLTQYDLSN